VRLGLEKTLAVFHRECDQNANARAPSIYGLWRGVASHALSAHRWYLAAHDTRVAGVQLMQGATWLAVREREGDFAALKIG
jgi:hypothetical protein